ncbi:MAG: hypothetical protein QOE17_390 [Gaiellales bacterium]|jgi:hypothetical protein|nr:hypothetical protein [Actinomycetota bacterium]MDX6494404.1 hypothetical protein [Gaiellales bacterium]
MPNPPVPAKSPVEWIALTIDCADAESQQRLRKFYADALGGEIVEGSVRARGMLLSFQALPNYRPPTWPSDVAHIHFEWAVHDLDVALSWLQDRGARLAEHQDPKDVGLRVMLDPAGHPFCVMTTASVRPSFRDEATYQQR